MIRIPTREEQIKQWAYDTRSTPELVEKALEETRQNLGDGWVDSYYWEKGAASLCEWYSRGRRTGRRDALKKRKK